MLSIVSRRGTVISAWCVIVMCMTVISGSLVFGNGDPSSFTAESTSVASTGGGTARIMMDSPLDVQGFVVSMSHDPTMITLTGIDISGTDTETANAEFVVPTVYVNGGTLGVVLDFNAPYDGQVIPQGIQLQLQ